MTVQQKKNSKELLDKAKSVLDKNFLGTYTCPAVGLYPHQVLWDTCFIAIGKSNYDTSSARFELKSLLRGQWKNGMVPNIIFNEDPKYKLDRRIWRSKINTNAPMVATTGITQPPVVATSVRMVGEKLNDVDKREFYREIIDYLVAYHEWLYNERDPYDMGLVIQIHPWETGLDNTPPWMRQIRKEAMPNWIKFLEISRLEKIGTLFRTDEKFTNKGERVTNIEGLTLYILLRYLRSKRYYTKDIIRGSRLEVADLTFNSILVKSNIDLLKIAQDINFDLPKKLIDKIKKTETSFNKFWDESSAQYYSLDMKTKKLIKEPSVATFMPLYSGIIPKENANKLVELIKNDTLYNTNFPIPSVPVNSKWFSSNRYWQGPTWVNINWFIVGGLSNYNFIDEANELKLKTLDMINSSGFYEYFSPNDGKGFGTDNFSWTAALAIDLLKQI